MSTYEDFATTAQFRINRARSGVIWRIVSRGLLEIQNHLREQRAIAQLEKLDDRLLQDIGIDRSEIRVAVMEGQRGPIARRL